MKKVTRYNLIILMATNLISGSIHAAVGDWVSRQKERSKSYLIQKINEAERKTQQFLTLLQTSARCLIQGDCPQERRYQLRVLAGTIIAAVVTITASAVIARYAQQEPDQEIIISQPGEMKTVSRVAIAKKHGVKIESEESRETPESLFMFAAETGGDAGLFLIQKLGNELPNNVLAAGREVAEIRRNQSIADYLKNLIKSNELLIEKANAGVLTKVQDVYCTVKPTPSSWSLISAMEKAGSRARQYQENSTQRRLFTDIENFLKNPSCKTAAPAG